MTQEKSPKPEGPTKPHVPKKPPPFKPNPKLIGYMEKSKKGGETRKGS